MASLGIPYKTTDLYINNVYQIQRFIWAHKHFWNAKLGPKIKFD